MVYPVIREVIPVVAVCHAVKDGAGEVHPPAGRSTRSPCPRSVTLASAPTGSTRRGTGPPGRRIEVESHHGGAEPAGCRPGLRRTPAAGPRRLADRAGRAGRLAGPQR